MVSPIDHSSQSDLNRYRGLPSIWFCYNGVATIDEWKLLFTVELLLQDQPSRLVFRSCGIKESPIVVIYQ